MTRTRRLLRWFLLAAGVCAAGGLLALRRFRLPEPTGPYAVGTCILNMTDESRNEMLAPNPAAKREVVVQLWYPAAPSRTPFAAYQRWRETTWLTGYAALLRTHSHLDAPPATEGSPFTVLLYAHRWNGERSQNTDLAEELASHGYVVAAIDHPYQASRVLLADGHVAIGTSGMEGPGGPQSPAADQMAFWNRELDAWAADARFVLDRLANKNATTNDPFHGRLNTDHAGAYGHSFGGAAALRLCGLDPRIGAAVNMDGWTFGGLRDRTAEQSVMMLYEGVYSARRHELERLPQPGSVQDQIDRADNSLVDASLSRYGGLRLVVSGSQHMDFTDQPLLPLPHRGGFTGPIAPLQMQTIVRRSVLEFFDQALRHEPSRLLQPQQGEFQEIKVEQYSAPAWKERRP